MPEIPQKAVWTRRGLWARFAPEVEQEFKAFYGAELRRRARPAALAAACVMAFYSVLDCIMIVPELVPAFLWMRSLFITGPMLFLWWAIPKPWMQHRLQWMCGIASMASGLAVIAMICVARRNGTPIEYEGIILMLFFYYCCGGLSLRTATLTGVTILFAYPVADYMSGLSQELTVTRFIFIASANIVGVLSTSLAELSARRNFALALQLRTLASRDYLTGLYNRRALRSQFDEIWAQAARQRHAVSVAMIDVDYFKRYNDHYGHSAGDAVLSKIAAALNSHTKRPLDAAARFGGEEFVCVWSGNDPASISALLDRLQHTVEKLAIPHAQSAFGHVTLSIGAVQVYPASGTTIKAALGTADKLLYQAKENGRNQAVFQAADGKCGEKRSVA